MRVINKDLVLEHAHDWGMTEFADIAGNADATPYDITGTDTYANIILPGLREMAGYEDAGAGTFTLMTDVVVVTPPVGYKYVTEGELVSSAQFLDEVVGAFFEGAQLVFDRDVAEASP